MAKHLAPLGELSWDKYLNKRLSIEEAEWAEAHLTECQQCRDDIGRSRNFWQRIAEDETRRAQVPEGYILLEDAKEMFFETLRIANGCPDTEGLAGYFDGTLRRVDIESAKKVRTHLKSCPLCRYDIDQLKRWSGPIYRIKCFFWRLSARLVYR